MRPFSLNGWQRLGVVASVLYAIPVALFTNLQLGGLPDERSEKRQWAISAVALLADYVDVKGEPLFEVHLFGTMSDDEVIKRIYSIPSTYHSLPAPTGAAIDPKDIERDCQQERKKALVDEMGHPLFDMEGRGGVDRCKLKILKGMIERGRLNELKDFNVENFKAQLVQLEADYRSRLEKAWKERVEVVGIGFLAWLLPVIGAYVLGLAVGWVHRGFKVR